MNRIKQSVNRGQPKEPTFNLLAAHHVPHTLLKTLIFRTSSGLLHQGFNTCSHKEEKDLKGTLILAYQQKVIHSLKYSFFLTIVLKTSFTEKLSKPWACLVPVFFTKYII